jgi:hypothetical protein
MGIVWYTGDLHHFPSHREDQSGTPVVPRSVRTRLLKKGGQIGLNLIKDRLSIGQIGLSELED